MGVKANIDMDTDVDAVEADGDLGATGATCALAAANGLMECTIGTLPVGGTSTVVFMVTAENAGPDRATNVESDMVLPAGLTFGSTGEPDMDTAAATADAGVTVTTASGGSTTMLMAGRRDECGAGAGRSGQLVVQGTRCA